MGNEKLTSMLMLEVNSDILRERLRQNTLWGTQRHPYYKWLAIALEEVGEISEAMQVLDGEGKPTDAQDLYEEIVQAAAVLQALGEHVKEDMEKEG